MQALADISSGKKKVLVPYRESVLTKLLQNALGGNRCVRADWSDSCHHSSWVLSNRVDI